MKISGLNVELQRMAAPVPIWYASILANDWLATAYAVREAGGRLVALWGMPQDTGASVCAAYVTLEGLLWLELPLAVGQVSYPDLVPVFRSPAECSAQRPTCQIFTRRMPETSAPGSIMVLG